MRQQGKFGFAELIVDGSVKLVEGTVSNSSNNRMSIYKEILVSREQEEAVIFNFAELISLKKRAIDYFSDCPIVVSKIEDSKYQRKVIKELVEFYTESCAK